MRTGHSQLIATHRLRGINVTLWRLGGETLVQETSGQPQAPAQGVLVT